MVCRLIFNILDADIECYCRRAYAADKLTNYLSSRVIRHHKAIRAVVGITWARNILVIGANEDVSGDGIN